MQLLLTELGDYRYGIPESEVVEILGMVAITPLPNAPAIVEGAVNIRGRVVPVLDIRPRFRLPAKPVSLSDHLVVCASPKRRFALRVDRAVDLVTIPEAAIIEVRSSQGNSDPLAGVATLPDGLVLIHDLDAFLSEAEAEALDSAEAG